MFSAAGNEVNVKAGQSEREKPAGEKTENLPGTLSGKVRTSIPIAIAFYEDATLLL